MKIVVNIKRFFYFFSFIGIFAYFIFISFNEELLFLSIFIIIVYSVYSLMAQTLSYQLVLYSNKMARAFILLASSKSLSLCSLRSYSKKILVLNDDILNLVIFSLNLVETMVITYEKEFRDSFILLKHKQLKLLVLEGYQFMRLLFTRRFMFYWSEIRNSLFMPNRLSTITISNSSNLTGFYMRLVPILTWLDCETVILKDHFIVNYFDLIFIIVFLRIMK